jgi:hypothetical protein
MVKPLLVAAATDSGQVRCREPRETIHAERFYSNIIGPTITADGGGSNGTHRAPPRSMLHGTGN